MIGFFRRFRPSVLRNVIYTFIWNMGFVVVFTVLGLLFGPKVHLEHLLWANFVIANCIGYLIHGEFALGNTLLATRIWQRGFALRSAYYAGITIVGVFGGYWLGFALLAWSDARGFVFSAQGAGEIGLLSFIISAILASIFLARERQAQGRGRVSARARAGRGGGAPIPPRPAEDARSAD